MKSALPQRNRLGIPRGKHFIGQAFLGAGTRVFGEAYSLYAAAGNPWRTQIRAKRAIYGWQLIGLYVD